MTAPPLHRTGTEPGTAPVPSTPPASRLRAQSVVASKGEDALQKGPITMGLGLLAVGLVTAATIAVVSDDHIVELLCIASMAGLVALTLRRMRKATRDAIESHAQLQISEERFALAMHGTNEGLWDVDLASNAVYSSPRWHSMVGYAASEIVPTLDGFLRFIHPDDIGRVSKAVEEYLAGTTQQFSVEFRVRHKGGHYIPVLSRAAAMRAPDGRPVRLVGTILDLSELRSAQTALGTMEKKYFDIVEQSPEGIYQMRPDGSVLSANTACARMLGYESADDVVGVPGMLARSVVNPERFAALNKMLAEQGAVVGFEGRLRRKDGSIIWVSNTARAVRDDAGTLRYVEGFLEDITARKDAEQMKADFVSFVTHQLRTPLAAIKWLLELADGPDLATETESFIADARSSTDRLINLVNDLLDVSRLEGGRMVANPEALDLADVTAKVARDLHALIASKHLTIHLPPSGAAPPASMDSKLASEVVQNLLSNAIRYTPEGGTITIGARAVDRVVEWSIRDTGIGIPAGAQGRLFEKFFRADNAWTAHTEGTGLGLYMVRLIVERSGGRVWFESSEGKGATFYFTVPQA